MSGRTTTRCVWLLDTIRRYGRITRAQLEEAWLRSPHSEGKPLTRRTFCNHRAAAEELFGVNILCDPATFEYYIDNGSPGNQGVTDWLLNSVSLNDVLIEARDISDRIFVENVPSARDYLGTIIAALKGHNPVKFDYHSYTRPKPTIALKFEPYFLKLFKQRWYVVGRNVEENTVKTYALDRMRNVSVESETFEDDPDFDRANYFRDSYGIVVTSSEPQKIVLKVEPRQAKYFRALPLHASQTETVADRYSLFTYRMRITDDFMAELLSYGPKVTVMEPKVLRTMVAKSLAESLAEYDSGNP